MSNKYSVNSLIKSPLGCIEKDFPDFVLDRLISFFCLINLLTFLKPVAKGNPDTYMMLVVVHNLFSR